MPLEENSSREIYLILRQQIYNICAKTRSSSSAPQVSLKLNLINSILGSNEHTIVLEKATSFSKWHK
jgi:hypothetical protein